MASILARKNQESATGRDGGLRFHANYPAFVTSTAYLASLVSLIVLKNKAKNKSYGEQKSDLDDSVEGTCYICHQL
jgi:hypothetical protein